MCLHAQTHGHYIGFHLSAAIYFANNIERNDEP